MKKNQPASAAHSFANPIDPLSPTSQDHWDIRLYENLLPKNFEFYSLGRISLQEPPPNQNLINEATGIFFTLEGSLKVFVTLLIAEGFDLSLYAEVGNIIAAKLAYQLEQKQGHEWMISHPRILSKRDIDQVASAAGPRVVRQYHHSKDGHPIPFKILLSLAGRRDIGNA